MSRYKALLAAVLQFKPSIFARIVLRDPNLKSQTGLEVRVHPLIEPIPYLNISKAVSEAVNSLDWVSVKYSKGEYEIKYKDDLMLFRSEEAERSEEIPVHLCLAFAPSDRVRLKFLEFIFDDLSVSQSRLEYFKHIASERVFSHSDYEELINEIINMPMPIIQDMESKWMSQTILFPDLLPQSKYYYENIMGVDGGTDAEEFLNEVFPKYLRQIFLNSPEKGIHYCFPLMMKATSDPNKYLYEATDEAIFELLQTVDLRKNYFTLLNVLKVAIFRAKGRDKFYELAEKCVGQILENPDGSLYSHAFFGAVVDFCIRHLGVNPDTANMSSIWRRMAGFAHANIVVDILKLNSPDQKRFMAELDRVVTVENNFVCLRDQAAEPLWTIHDLSGLSLSVELFSQLEEVLSIYDSQDFFSDLKEKVSSAVAEKKKNVNFSIRFGSPGPLEAHHNKEVERNALESSDFDAIESMIQGDILAEKPWSLLSLIGRTRKFSAEMIIKVSELIEKLTFSEEGSSNFFDCIALASYISASQLSELLANSIREKIKQSASKLSSAEEARTVLFVLTIASGGIPKDQRDFWLADAVAQIAFLLPKGTICQSFEEIALSFNNYIPLNEIKWSRAIKIASLGR